MKTDFLFYSVCFIRCSLVEICFTVRLLRCNTYLATAEIRHWRLANTGAVELQLQIRLDVLIWKTVFSFYEGIDRHLLGLQIQAAEEGGWQSIELWRQSSGLYHSVLFFGFVITTSTHVQRSYAQPVKFSILSKSNECARKFWEYIKYCMSFVRTNV